MLDQDASRLESLEWPLFTTIRPNPRRPQLTPRSRERFMSLPAHKSVAEAQPLIAVRDVRASSRWYAELLGADALPDHPHRDVYDRIWRSGRLLLQLHAWDAEEPPQSRQRQTRRRPGMASCCGFRSTISTRPSSARAGSRRRSSKSLISTRRPSTGRSGSATRTGMWWWSPVRTAKAAPDGRQARPRPTASTYQLTRKLCRDSFLVN